MRRLWDEVLPPITGLTPQDVAKAQEIKIILDRIEQRIEAFLEAERQREQRVAGFVGELESIGLELREIRESLLNVLSGSIKNPPIT